MVPGMLVNPLRTGLYETLEDDGRRHRAYRMSGSSLARSSPTSAFANPLLRLVTFAPSRSRRMIDEIPALAVACAFADGESVIEGLGELRVKESDRLGAIVAGLTACGVTAIADGDSLRIFGRGKVRGGASVSTQGDHRIAMAFLRSGAGGGTAGRG